MKKKLKIIIPALVVIIVLAILAVVVFAGNNIAFTDKAKISKGFSKTMDSFSVSEGLKTDSSNYQYIKNIDSNPYEAETTMSINADVDDLEDLVDDEDLAEFITQALDELANTTITAKVANDSSNKQATVEVTVNSENLIGEISADAAIDEETLAFRSEDLNKDYLAINKDDSDEFEEIFEMLNSMLFEKKYSDMFLTDEEINHFKETYGSILSDYITNDMISSEKTEYEVDGNKKSCTKEVLTFNNDQLKEILTKYVETFENDETGRKIIETKLNSIYGEDLASEINENIDDAIDEIKDTIDEIEDTKLEFVTYATLFDVYGTEVIVTVDEESAKITENFNGDTTNIAFVIEDEEVANASITKSDKNMEIKGSIIDDENTVNLDLTISEESIKATIEALEDEEKIGTVTISCDVDNKKNSSKEYDADIKLAVAFDIVDEISGNFEINMSQKLNIVDSIEFPDLSDAVEYTDEDDLGNWISTNVNSLSKYEDKLKKSDLYDGISDYILNYSDDDDYDYTFDYDDDEYYTIDDEVDPEDLKDDIEFWFEYLDEDEDLTNSERIEAEMISEDDFLDEVSVELYTTWEKGEATDKGYLGINVIDEAGNSYEFYINIKTGTIYDEDNAPDEIENLDWISYK